jgi:hypothetical protein
MEREAPGAIPLALPVSDEQQTAHEASAFAVQPVDQPAA